MFENLLGNALRFAKKKIWVICSLEDGMFRLAIRDDGLLLFANQAPLGQSAIRRSCSAVLGNTKESGLKL